jgi:hypothetical protein
MRGSDAEAGGTPINVEPLAASLSPGALGRFAGAPGARAPATGGVEP